MHKTNNCPRFCWKSIVFEHRRVSVWLPGLAQLAVGLKSVVSNWICVVCQWRNRARLGRRASAVLWHGNSTDALCVRAYKRRAVRPGTTRHRRRRPATSQSQGISTLLAAVYQLSSSLDKAAVCEKQRTVACWRSEEPGHCCVKLSIMNSSCVSKFQLTVFLVAEQKIQNKLRLILKLWLHFTIMLCYVLCCGFGQCSKSSSALHSYFTQYVLLEK